MTWQLRLGAGGVGDSELARCVTGKSGGYHHRILCVMWSCVAA